MKNILFIFICVLVTVGCSKSNDQLSSDGGSKLTSIYSDSAGTLKFEYTGNLITGVAAGSMEPGLQNFANITYASTDSGQIISVAFQGSNYYTIVYTLNPSKLPLSIDVIIPSGGVTEKLNEARFIYLPDSDLLDSVILGEAIYQRFIFKFAYINQNISEVTQYMVSKNDNVLMGTYRFAYSATPNIFRRGDSLLYIYSYPRTALSAQPMVVAAFFAETFSASTFNKITISGIINTGWYENPITSEMTYTLNANEKVTEEAFDNEIFDGLAGKRYFYQK